MPSPVIATLFGTLMVMVFVWFGIILWMFRRLRTRHAAEYEAMGSPSLFLNNNPRSGLLFLKFIFSSQSRRLGDPAVANVILFMRLFCIVYLGLFVLLIVLFFTTKA